MENKGPNTSRRKLLGAMAVTPAIAAAPAIISPYQRDLDILRQRYDNAPVKLLRTTEGRELSLCRYETAHEFFPDPRKPFVNVTGILPRSGAVKFPTLRFFETSDC